MTLSSDPSALIPAIGERLERAGLSVAEAALNQIAEHLALVLKWSGRSTLTAIRSTPEAIERHVLESVLAAGWIEPERGPLLDIGSGNGYPGIPMKCLHPETPAILLEPALRKSVFLRQVIETLGLRGIEVRRERVERALDLSRYAPCGSITLRAVAAVAAVIEGCPTALGPGGRAILLLGENSAGEATRSAKGSLRVVHDAPLPWRRSSRLLVLEKPREAPEFHVER